MAESSTIQDLINKPVVFFSKTECPYCDMLENDLTSMQIPYEKIMLTQEIREPLIELTNCKTVPQLFIGGVFMGGYKEFSALCGTGKITSQLSMFGINPFFDF